MAICILCVGKLKERWAREGCEEYLKRLSRFDSVEVREIADQPEPAHPSDALNQRVMEREGRDLLAYIKPTDRVVTLCINGKSYDSPAFARQLAAWRMDGKRLVLVIGGSLGLSPEVLDRADARLSFSDMTFPHQLMRIFLLEQLFRAFKINANERYHK